MSAEIPDPLGHRKLLEACLAEACRKLSDDLRKGLAEHVTESVFRYLVIRELRAASPKTECWDEWNAIDLVLVGENGAESNEKCASLVEFKFYSRRPKRHVSGNIKRYKGGPGGKNEREFEHALERLSRQTDQTWISNCGRPVSAFLVLAYIDDHQLSNVKQRFDSHYRDRAGEQTPISHKITLDSGGLLVLTCMLFDVQLQPLSS